jgi:hypothetical protein
MEGKLLLMFLDLMVLSALGGTIYYLRNVSNSIKIIREGRTELQVVLQQLNINISNAQHAIEGMRKLTDEKVKTLQKQVDTASAVIDELQYIQKAADNVAQRLETLTGKAGIPLRIEEESLVKEKTKASSRGQMSKAEKELSDVMAVRRAKMASE